MEKTYFITFEGIDGSGKDTQLSYLLDEIKKDNSDLFGNKYSHIWVTRNPTKITQPGIKISELIRQRDVSPQEAATLYTEDRKEHSQIIKQFLQYSHVLSSRYDVSTLVYQSAQGMNLDELYQMHQFGQENGCLHPDLTIIFDLPAEVAFNRINTRAEELECFEKLDFLKKAQTQHQVVADFLRSKGRNIITVNANQSIQDVKKEMLEKILNNFKENNLL